MMMNLFSIFDPSTSMFYSLNWISSLYVLVLIPFMYWFIPSRYMMFFSVMIKTLNKEFSVLLNNKINLMNLILYFSIFLIIMLNNFMGLFPYIFTSSSHLIFSLSLSMVLWISYMVFEWINNTNHMFIHLVPQGTPSVLMSFMVIIETISNVIRPGTLAVHLSANMICWSFIDDFNFFNWLFIKIILLIFMLLSQSILIILELSVLVIQAYVFSVLSTLYSVETN